MAIFGDNTAGTSSSPGTTDRAIVTAFTLTEDATINSAGAYFDAASTSGASAKVIVYNKSGGVPTSLVVASGATAVPAGGGLVTFTMSGSLTAGDYYVGVVYSDFQANTQVDDSLSGMDSCMANGTLSYASPPGTWPGSDINYDNIRANAYIDYTAAGGAISQAGFRWRNDDGSESAATWAAAQNAAP